MNETDYIRATNRVKVSAALHMLRDVLPGDGFGISANELGRITRPLREAEERLFASYELEEPND